MTWVSCVEDLGTPMTYLPISALAVDQDRLGGDKRDLVGDVRHGILYRLLRARAAWPWLRTRMSTRRCGQRGIRLATASRTNSAFYAEIFSRRAHVGIDAILLSELST